MRLIQIYPDDADGVRADQPTMIDADQVIALRPQGKGTRIVLPDDWAFTVRESVETMARLVDPTLKKQAELTQGYFR